MTPHPWRILRLFAYLLPALLLVCVWVGVLAGYRSVSSERMFVEDAAYRHLVVAEVLMEHREYGLHVEERLPMIRDVLWQVGVAILRGWNVRGVVALQLLGLLCSLGALLLLVQAAHRIYPHPLYAFGAAIGLALSPGFVLAAVSGTAEPMLTLLITAAMLHHLGDLCRRGVGLPMLSVVLLGLAMWIRLEAVVVLLFLWLHTLLLSAMAPAPRPPFLNGLVRGLNALLVLALILLPWVVWNVSLLNVPVPRMPGVPLAADVWTLRGAATAWELTASLIPMGWAESASAFRRHALPVTFWTRLLWVTGWLALTWQVVTVREDRSYLLLLLAPILIPLLLALCYPYMGSSGFVAISQAMLPCMWLVAAYGWTRVPSLAESLAIRLGFPPVSLRSAAWIWWATVGLVLLLSLLGGLSRAYRTEKTRLTEQAELRQQIARHVGDAVWITDQPGWLVWRHSVRVWDLEARWSPALLRLVGEDGTYDLERLKAYLKQSGNAPAGWLLWSTGYDAWALDAPSARILMHRDEWDPHCPLMVILDEPAAF